MNKSQITNLVLLFTSILICSCEKNENQSNKAPICSITSPDNGEEIVQGTTVTISVDADDTDGNVTEVRFYVDGFGVGSSSNFPYNYEWNTTGEETESHTIKVIAKDNEGSSTTDEINIEIVGVAPVTDFSVDITEISTGTQIQFTDKSTNTPTSWEWDFGDGGTSSLQNPSYTYSSIGYYTVTLTSTNIYGSDSESKTNYITVLNNIVTGSFTDSRDGKTYKTVQIGNQVWMAENLNYETSSGSWVYDNNSSYAPTYGRLYNWETANDVCPSGWHLPSDDEWKQLEMAIGMSQSDADDSGLRGTDEGAKLKATSGWNSNGNGTDEYGFTALPGASRHQTGFSIDGYDATFWSSTASSSYDAWLRHLRWYREGVYRNGNDKYLGFSVRCVRD